MFLNQFFFLILGGRTIWLPNHFKDEENKPQRLNDLLKLPKSPPSANRNSSNHFLAFTEWQTEWQACVRITSLHIGTVSECCSLNANMLWVSFFLYSNISKVDQFYNQCYHNLIVSNISTIVIRRIMVTSQIPGNIELTSFLLQVRKWKLEE